MGHCASICTNSKGKPDLNMDNLSHSQFDEKKYFEYVGLIIYIQRKYRKFKENQKNKKHFEELKDKVKQKTPILNLNNTNNNQTTQADEMLYANNTTQQNNNEETNYGNKEKTRGNDNYKIVVNNQMAENTYEEQNNYYGNQAQPKISAFEEHRAKYILQNQNSNRSGNDGIIIPDVRREYIDFKKTPLFSYPFKLGASEQNLPADDPRLGPIDGRERWYDNIVDGCYSYTGIWKDQKLNNFGILRYRDEMDGRECQYRGQFVDSHITGFGEMIGYSDMMPDTENGNKNSYLGYWEDFKASGVGKFTTDKNTVYQGYWKDDMQDGYGKEVWPESSKYEGDYVKGSKQGIGYLSFEFKGGYEGEFSDGHICGVGTFFFHDNRKYEGEWRDNKMNGLGIVTWPDGKVFEGRFENDKKEGFGVFYSTKKIYMGYWRDSLLVGDIIIIQNDIIKKQKWEDGKAKQNLSNNYNIEFQDKVAEVIERAKELNIAGGNAK